MDRVQTKIELYAPTRSLRALKRHHHSTLHLVKNTQSSAELTVHLTLLRTESGLATFETVSDCKKECVPDNINNFVMSYPSPVENVFNPLTPTSDQDRISPYGIKTISTRQVMRINWNVNVIDGYTIESAKAHNAKAAVSAKL